MLRADRRSTVSIGIIAPTIDTCIWNIQWKEITEPVDTVYSPSHFSIIFVAHSLGGIVVKSVGRRLHNELEEADDIYKV